MKDQEFTISKKDLEKFDASHELDLTPSPPFANLKADLRNIFEEVDKEVGLKPEDFAPIQPYDFSFISEPVDLTFIDKMKRDFVIAYVVNKYGKSKEEALDFIGYHGIDDAYRLCESDATMLPSEMVMLPK